jgi:methyl-accepting chemotaxis protein
MNFVQNAKISSKILALIIALGVLTLGVAVYGSREITRTTATYASLTDVAMPNNTQLARINRRVTEMAYAAYRTIAHDGASREAREAAKTEAEAYKQAIDALAQVKKSEPELASHTDGLSARISQLHAVTQDAVRHGMVNDNARASAIMDNADRDILALGEDMKAFNDGRVAAAAKQSAELTQDSNATAWKMLVASVGGIVAGVLLSLWFARKTITGPILGVKGKMDQLASGDHHFKLPEAARADEVGAMAKAVLVFRDAAVAKEKADAAKAAADAEQKMVVETLVDGLGKLSNGDLTSDIRAEFSPSYASVKANFNSAMEALRGLIGSVAESAASIRTGSGEIAQASEDLARRTEGNAASLEETSAALTQIDGRLKATAVAAARTVERADQAISTVGGGRAIADEAVQAMGRVSDSAKGIDSVIEGLDKIAFQTRVLAMNAAVEAGRAGDAGRGFAVVADLVSALAMRAEEEAKRARDQLTVTQTDIVTAVEAVQKVDGALANISGDVGEVHQLLGTMAADNQAQSSAITQISVAVGSMDQSTQQNAAMVEETSAAARNLSAEVSSLSEQASRFKVGDHRSPARGKTLHKASGSPAAEARYTSPVKALPAAAVAVLTRPDAESDWNDF